MQHWLGRHRGGGIFCSARSAAPPPQARFQPQVKISTTHPVPVAARPAAPWTGGRCALVFTSHNPSRLNSRRPRQHHITGPGANPPKTSSPRQSSKNDRAAPRRAAGHRGGRAHQGAGQGGRGKARALHPEHHHFYDPKKHMGKRMLRVVIAGTGVSTNAVHAMRWMAAGGVRGPGLVGSSAWDRPLTVGLTPCSPLHHHTTTVLGGQLWPLRD